MSQEETPPPRPPLGPCCHQKFNLGDKVRCISSGDYGWICRVKRLHVKNSFVICWSTGPRKGKKNMFLSQNICNDFEKLKPRIRDQNQVDIGYFNPD